MSSARTIRDPVQDHLLTPQNSAMLFIDFQPEQISSIKSRDRSQLVRNVVSIAKLAGLFGLPIVLSTINVASGLKSPMIDALADVFPGAELFDRTAINAWEDEDFLRCVKATSRTKLIIAALPTEVSLVYPALDALREGFDVFPVVDAVGSATLEAHETGLQRLVQAGAQPTTGIQLAYELQRDWNREKTAGQVTQILSA